MDIFHRDDPTRPVTTGNDQIAADGHPATLAFLNAEDVVGYNYVDRWHERREPFAESDLRRPNGCRSRGSPPPCEVPSWATESALE